MDFGGLGGGMGAAQANANVDLMSWCVLLRSIVLTSAGLGKKAHGRNSRFSLAFVSACGIV